MNHITKLFLIAVAMVTAIPSFAVTDQEMEQARVMAAKHYLRYANNGSDYLDRLNPSSMGELQKSLKAKELENIKSFNAVAVPKDYASWDKAKLVQYWSSTFFKSAGLKEDGKKCLGVLSKNLAKIEVKAPSAATQQPATATPQPAAETQPSPTPAPSAAPAAGTTDAASEEDIAVQANADSPAPEIEEERPQKSSGTGWYIAILVVLIGVVVWLVMYAQKSMKETGQVVADHKNSEKEVREAKRAAKEEVNKMRDQYAASISTKNDEIKQLRARCEALEEEVESLRKEAARLSAQSAKQMQAARISSAPSAPAPARESRPAASSDAPRQSSPRQNTLPPVVYLGYVNPRGLFVKASRSLNAETSVYRMDIPDGVHGSYRVVSDPSILDRLLEDTNLWLANGCEIENPQDADIATEIMTLSPGEALFADNTCRVVRKARIKFI